MLAEVWRGLGFWTLYFLASLQNIPEELLDAARVDGARGFQRFRRVTIPLLRPMLLFAVVIAIIANFQVFDTVYILTQGGPVQSTSTMVWFIWERLFQFQQTGQGYAAAVILLGIILFLTAISFWFLGRAANGGRPADGGRQRARSGSRKAPSSTPTTRGAARRRRTIDLGKGIAAYAVLTLFAVIAIGPFLYLLSPSFRHSYDLFTFPPQWLPKSLYLGQLRHGAPSDELPPLGAQHVHLRHLGDADHARDRHARRLRLRAPEVPRPRDSLRAS